MHAETLFFYPEIIDKKKVTDMMTVQEVSKLTGVSIRTLHHYHKIGLLQPTEITEAGYRLYDEDALERLQCILLFKEMEFPLKDIRGIIDSPVFERNKALDQQITLLQLKKEHIENLIDLATGIKAIGVRNLDFTAFDTKKIDEYARDAKARWGTTPEYHEFQEKSKGRTKEEEHKIHVEFMDIFKEFGQMLSLEPTDDKVQKQVKKLQDFISEHMYTCSDQILNSLGKMYSGGGSFTVNIDNYAGEGTAVFTAKAIEIYCNNK